MLYIALFLIAVAILTFIYYTIRDKFRKLKPGVRLLIIIGMIATIAIAISIFAPGVNEGIKEWFKAVTG